MRSFRIVRAEYPAADGRGAAIAGGLWNRRGTRLVYTADSVATALLETFAEDAKTGRLQDLKVASFNFPKSMVATFDMNQVNLEDPKSRERFGEQWLEARTFPVMKVPSSRVQGGWIYLINPEHPDVPFFRVTSDSLSLLAKDNGHEKIGKSGLQVDSWNGLVDVHGHPIRSDRAKAEVRGLERDMLAHLRERPQLLLELSPRDFERAMGAFYEERGWEVTLTPESKDGGKDLIIVKRDEAGKRICYVECKRYDPERPVGVGIIRQLWGVVDKDSATSGIVAATSFFTKGAVSESLSPRIAHRMTLYDYQALIAMLTSNPKLISAS